MSDFQPWVLVDYSNSYRTWKRVYTNDNLVVFEDGHFIPVAVMERIVADHNDLHAAQAEIKSLRELLKEAANGLDTMSGMIQVDALNPQGIEEEDDYEDTLFNVGELLKDIEKALNPNSAAGS